MTIIAERTQEPKTGAVLQRHEINKNMRGNEGQVEADKTGNLCRVEQNKMRREKGTYQLSGFVNAG